MPAEINLQSIPLHSQISVETIRDSLRRLWVFDLIRMEPNRINPVQFVIKPTYGVTRELHVDLAGIFHALANGEPSSVNTIGDMLVRPGDALRLETLKGQELTVLVDSLWVNGRPVIDRRVKYKIYLGQTAYYHEVRDNLIDDPTPQEFCGLKWWLEDGRPTAITAARPPELPVMPQRLLDAITWVDIIDLMVMTPPRQQSFYDEAERCSAEIRPDSPAGGRAWLLKASGPNQAAALRYRQRVLVDKTATPRRRPEPK